MDVKNFSVSINIKVDGKYFSSNQIVDGDVDSKLVKQMYAEAYNKVLNQINTKYPDEKAER